MSRPCPQAYINPPAALKVSCKETSATTSERKIRISWQTSFQRTIQTTTTISYLHFQFKNAFSLSLIIYAGGAGLPSSGKLAKPCGEDQWNDVFTVLSYA